MAEPIMRQATAGLNTIQKIATGGQPTTRASTNNAIDTSNYGLNVLNSLTKAAGSYADFKVTEEKMDREADIVKQRNQAVMTKRPTDDSTQAGYVAHSIVNMQNKSIKLRDKFKQDSKTFSGSDEEWTNHLVSGFQSLQDEVLAEYPPVLGEADKTSQLSAITDMFSEHLNYLSDVRVSDSLEQEQIKRVTAFQDNILLKSADLDGDSLAKAMTSVMNENRLALKLTEQEAEKVLVSAAVDAANQGDSRLIEFTKNYSGSGKSPLYKRYGELQQAAKVAGKVWAAENQGSLAVAKDELNSSFMSGTMSWSEYTKAAEQLNKTTGNTAYTDSELLSAKQSRASKTATAVDVSEYLKSDKILGLVVGDNKMRQKIVEAKTESLGLIGQAWLRQSGKEGDPEAAAIVAKRLNVEKAKWLSNNQLVDEDWKNIFEVLPQFNLANQEPDASTPDEFNKALDLWYTLDDGSRLAHTTPKTAALMQNFDIFRQQGMTSIQALQNAQKSVNNPQKFTGKQLTEISDSAIDVADDLTSGSILPWDSAPDWYRERVRRMLSDATLANMQAGYVDKDKAATDAGKAIENNYTTLNNGQMIFGRRSELAEKMQVHPEDIELTLDTYLERNKTVIEDASGTTIDRVYFDRQAGRDIIYIRSGDTGFPVGSPILLSDLKVGRDNYLANSNTKVSRAVVGSELYEEEERAKEKIVTSILNDNKAGYDKRTKLWTPVDDTIGYGHKLTPKEKSDGFITIGKDTYKFEDGDSEITEYVAKKLLAADSKVADSKLQVEVKGFADLSKRQQAQVRGIYISGKLTPELVDSIKAHAKTGSMEPLEL